MAIQKVQFKESKYQAFVEYSFREYFNKHTRFEIEHYQGVSENKRGYDLEVRSLIPLFLQLKVCDFTPSFSSSALIADRRALGFTDNPGHYQFGLHPDKKSSLYKQHNLLNALHHGGAYARYVAPLFYTSKALEHYSYSKPPPKWGIYGSALTDAGLGQIFDWRDYEKFEHGGFAREVQQSYNVAGQVS
ncbi:hypothetical protein [Xanthomonas cucurbitae]|uniref:Uncharacterized protein n=1 Tax=Xanthomonas cucurbitae TaxID=56453 RepID=A0ABY7YBX1_9XANT|nr:hypothetical protein [Xanthomonas cucurbitae]WDM67475.1 hypothetical protein K6981_18770 [Xanthomonas cucurbitae]WDM71351.1 hypothetical protein K6978_18735 [Xanthomonas cucurbitae]